MSATENKPARETYDRVVASEDGLREVEAGKVMIFLPAGEIESMVLKHGRTEHRPLISLGIGLIMTAVGVDGMVGLVRTPSLYRLKACMIVLGLFGGAIIFDALKTRFFLEAKTTKGNFRLVFSPKADLAGLRKFLESAHTNFNFKVVEDAALTTPGVPSPIP